MSSNKIVARVLNGAEKQDEHVKNERDLPMQDDGEIEHKQLEEKKPETLGKANLKDSEYVNGEQPIKISTSSDDESEQSCFA